MAVEQEPTSDVFIAPSPWVGRGAKAHLDELTHSEIPLPKALNMLLEARWKGETIMSQNGHEPSVLYKGMFPTHELLNQSTVLGLLDKVGIGPEELKQIIQVRHHSPFNSPRAFPLPDTFGTTLDLIKDLAKAQKIPPSYGMFVEEILGRFDNLTKLTTHS